MTPDLSYYWEGAREWCEDNKWDEEKSLAKVQYFYHTAHPYPFPRFFFLDVSILLSRQKNIDRFVEESWCREGVREGTQGYQLRLETAPVLRCRFLISGVELSEARGDRNGGVRAWGWGEAHRVRFTPALLLCSLLDLYLWNVQGTFS